MSWRRVTRLFSAKTWSQETTVLAPHVTKPEPEHHGTHKITSQSTPAVDVESRNNELWGHEPNSSIWVPDSRRDLDRELYMASAKGSDNKVVKLLAQGADVNAQAYYEGTALQVAAAHGHYRTVKVLLNYDADVNIQGGIYGTALKAASARGDERIVRILLDHGAAVNSPREGPGGSALLAAIHLGHDRLVRTLLDHGAAVNNPGGVWDGSALLAAISRGHDRIVRTLIDYGAAVNDPQGGSHGSPLRVALEKGHEQIVRVLLDNGADVDHPGGGTYCTLLQWASEQGHEQFVRILLNYGAQVNAQGGPRVNALYAASIEGHEQIVRILLESGAQADMRGGFCGTALQAASVSGRAQIVQILLDHGVDVNARGGHFGSALEAASAEGHLQIVLMLLDSGAYTNPQEGGRYGDAVQAALKGDHPTIVGILRDWHPSVRSLIEGAVRAIFKPGRPLTFTMCWELDTFVKTQLDGSIDLGSLLAVSEYQGSYYASCAADLVREVWGTDAVELLDQACTWGNTPKEKTRVTARLLSSHGNESSYSISIAAQPFGQIMTTVQTLAWMAAVFRVPKEGRPCLSTVDVDPRSDAFRMSLANLSPVMPDTPSSCWQDLLPSTNIAVGDLVRIEGGNGLRLPFDVLLDLTDVLFQTDLSKLLDSKRRPTVGNAQDYGIFYSSATGILYPVSKITGAKTLIRWHFDNAGKRKVPPNTWLRLREEEIMNADHALGFTSEVEVHLGTQDRLEQYDLIKPSSAKKEFLRRGLQFDTLSFSLGRQPAVFNFGGRITYTRGQRTTINSETRKYDQMIEAAKDQSVILYDSMRGGEKAWLVSQLCVILDLVYLQIYRRRWPAAATFARPRANGAAAAEEVFRDRNFANHVLCSLLDDDSDYKIKDLVKEIYISMANRDTSDAFLTPGVLQFHHERLYGWDLLELVNPPKTSFRRELAIHKTTSNVITEFPSWMNLARGIPVYFGDNLGQIITSRSQSKLNTLHGPKHLVASMYAMQGLSKISVSCDDLHLDCGLVWEYTKAFKEIARKYSHPRAPSANVWSLIGGRLQFLVDNHQCEDPTSSPLYQDAKLLPLYAVGAVVFGPKSNILTRFNDLADSLQPQPS